MKQTIGKNDSILDRIVAAKRKRIADQKKLTSLASMVSDCESTIRELPPMSFDHAIGTGDSVSVIAEMKRSSPSAGNMDLSLDPAQRAEIYSRAGASAISVLTEQDHFRGTIDDLKRAANVAHEHDVAVLEKDFVIDEYQIYEARASGADTILLIIAILDAVQYTDLYAISAGLGMEPLVEVFDEYELETALNDVNPKIVGVNNRNLKTLTTSLEVFPRVARRIPDGIIKVAESGMRTPDDVQRMVDAGAKAVLVGESLMTADGDPSELISKMTTLTV